MTPTPASLLPSPQLQVHTSDFSSLATSDLEFGNDALTGSTLETPEQEARWREKQHEVGSRSCVPLVSIWIRCGKQEAPTQEARWREKQHEVGSRSLCVLGYQSGFVVVSRKQEAPMQEAREAA